MDKWVIFKHDAIPSTLAENAAKEALAAPKKPTTDELWCEKELGKECGKIIGVCTQILDGVGLPTTEAREGRLTIHLFQISKNSELGSIVEPTLKRNKTYVHVVEILPGTENVRRSLILPGDYILIVPLVLEGLPVWAEAPSSNKQVVLQWTKGSILVARKGTNLVCSRDGGGIFMVLGVQHLAQTSEV